MDSSNAEKATDRELWDIAQSVYEPGSRSAYAPFDHPDLIDGHRAVYDAGRDDANAYRDAEVAELREQLAAAWAVIEAIRAEWDRGLETDLLDWEGLTPILATAPSAVLEDRDRENRAIGWDEGFEAGEQDVMEHNRTSWSADCSTSNPYRGDKQ